MWHLVSEESMLPPMRVRVFVARAALDEEGRHPIDVQMASRHPTARGENWVWSVHNRSGSRKKDYFTHWTYVDLPERIRL